MEAGGVRTGMHSLAQGELKLHLKGQCMFGVDALFHAQNKKKS